MTRVEKTTEQPSVSQPEILDIGNYGGLYGRLLLASLSPEEEVSNIINPAIKRVVEPSQITIKDGNYNPITAKLSGGERVDAWKDVKFTDAYAQWRAKLTKSIKSTTDEKKIAAIEAVSGKLASEFSEEDTDKLYDTFCKGKSDTTAFARTVIANLQIDGKVDTKRVAALSSDIEWVASGLFGKETAVTVSRIIELEAEIANNKPEDVVKKIFSDKERINKLTEQETEILTKLYGGLNAVRIKTESPHAQTDTIIQEPIGKHSAVEEPEPSSSAQAIRDEITREAFFNQIERAGIGKTPTSSAESIQSASREPAEPESVIDGRIRFVKGHQIQYQGKPYTISDIKGDNVKLLGPNGQSRTIDQKNLEELLATPHSPWKLLDKEGRVITLPTTEPERIDDKPLAPAPIDRDVVPPGTFYADRTSSVPDNPALESRKKVILLESSGADFVKDLNTNLLNQTEPDTTFSVPVETLRRYLTSIAGNKLIYSGNLTVNKDENEIVVNGLKIDGGLMAGKIKISLSLINTSKGIDAQITNYEGRSYARGTVEQQVARLNTKFREMIDAEVVVQNPAWKSTSVVIAEDRILLGFHDTRSTEGNLPA